MIRIAIFLSVLVGFVLYNGSVNASELDFKFHSPSFSGVGKSSHYLTIENIEKTRKDAIKAAEKADAEKAKAEAKAKQSNVIQSTGKEKAIQKTIGIKCTLNCLNKNALRLKY